MCMRRVAENIIESLKGCAGKEWEQWRKGMKKHDTKDIQHLNTFSWREACYLGSGDLNVTKLQVRPDCKEKWYSMTSQPPSVQFHRRNVFLYLRVTCSCYTLLPTLTSTRCRLRISISVCLTTRQRGSFIFKAPPTPGHTTQHTRGNTNARNNGVFEVLWLPEEKRPTLLDVPSSLWFRGGQSGKGGRWRGREEVRNSEGGGRRPV